MIKSFYPKTKIFLENFLHKVTELLSKFLKYFYLHNSTIAIWIGVIISLVGLIGLVFAYFSFKNDWKQYLLDNSPSYTNPISVKSAGKDLVIVNNSKVPLYLTQAEYWSPYDLKFIVLDPRELDILISNKGKIIFALPERVKKNDFVGVKFCYFFKEDPLEDEDRDIKSKLFFYYNTNYPIDYFDKIKFVASLYPSDCSTFFLKVKDGQIENIY